MPSSAETPVLVVGAGPVGLTMAAHLHHHGVACRIIDRAPAPNDKSKALVVWGRSLEMFDSLGIVDGFLATGVFLKAACIYRGSRPMARIPFEVAGTPYPKPLMIAQNETERLLTEHLQQFGIAVERAVELTDFTDAGSHVLATLHRQAETPERVRCNWLLGCDGSHSITRKKAGLDFSGEEEPNDWILADCRIAGISQEELSLFWHSQGVLAFFPFAPGRCRVIADLGKARTASRPPDPSLEQVQDVVNQRGPGGVRLSEPHWLSGFRIHERKVREYHRGRVFLAGDAAHIHSPAGGQGMNTGMQDAWNLAWKLALVESGCAHASLLDSYSPERSAVGDMVLRNAARLTGVVLIRNPIGQFIRNVLVGMVGRFATFRRAFVNQLTEMTVHYPHSPLNGETADGWESSGIHPGDRVSDADLCEPSTGNRLRLMRVLGGLRHSLLLLPAAPDLPALASLHEISQLVDRYYGRLIKVHLIMPGHSVPAELSRFAAFASIWLDADARVRQLIGAREPALALVRPDGYLGYRSQPPSWEQLNTYLGRYLIPRPA